MATGRPGISRLGIALFFSVAALSLLAVACSSQSGPLSLDKQEELAQAIDKSLMCPVCPSETIDQSQVEIAKQMRAMVREKLAQGESREDILQFFADRYGPGVLAEPPKHGFNLLVWVIPPVLLALGSGILAMAVHAMRKTQPPAISEKEPLLPRELDPYLAMVDQEIQRLTRRGDEVGGPAAPSSEEPDRRAYGG
ncbi:MAG: cytochrome c-type biogenesis protein CcmH [Chloroflexi bacterium]|nr:cytochrome c-type biogenesis protein CcmH [Chloroflexota bacterium]